LSAVLNAFREKNPEYDNMSDYELADFFYEKEYSDLDRNDYFNRLGINPVEQETGAVDYALGYVPEVGKALSRGFSQTFTGGVSGAVGFADSAANMLGQEDLIDSGDDNEIIKFADDGKKYIDENLGIGDAYRDDYSVKVAEAIGSIGGMMALTAGAVGATTALGASAPVAGLVGTGAAILSGITLNADDQRQRIEASKARGIDVDQDDADTSIVLGGLFGATEAFTPLRVLKKIRGIKEPRDRYNKLEKEKQAAIERGDTEGAGRLLNEQVKVQREMSRVLTKTDRIVSALKTGTFEGVQELTNSLVQDAIQNYNYDDSIEVGDSLWDDLTVGFGAGALVDGVSVGFANRRNRAMRDSLEEKELELREKEEEQRANYYQESEKVLREIERDNRLAREAAAIEGRVIPPQDEQVAALGESVRGGRPFNPNQQLNPETGLEYGASTDTEYNKRVGKTYASQIARDASQEYGVFPESGTFSVVAEETVRQVINPVTQKPEQVPFTEYKVVHSTTDQEYGTPAVEYESAAHLASNLNQELINRTLTNSVIGSIDLSSDTYTPQQAEALFMVGQKVVRPDNLSITAEVLNEAGRTTSGFGSKYNEGVSIDSLHMQQYGVPAFSDRGERIYKPLSDLTVSQEINYKRRQQGLPEKDTFTLAEAKKALGEDFSRVFDVMAGVKETTAADQITDFGTVGAEIARSREEYKNNVATQQAIQDVLQSKNITVDIDSPGLQYIFEQVVNETNISDMSPSQRLVLVSALEKLPIVPGDSPVSLPDFRPKPYSRRLYNEALEHVRYTKDGSLENIQDFLGEKIDNRRLEVTSSKLREALVDAGVINADGTIPELQALESPPPSPVFEPEPYSEEATSELAQDLEKGLKKKLKGYGLEDIKLRVLDALKFGRVTADGQLILTGEPGETTAVEDAEGFFLQPPRTVFLAIDRANDSAKDESPEAREAALSEVLDHEIVHALRNLDLWTDAEWSLLERAAKTRVYPGTGNETFFNNAQRRYKYLSPVGQMEEAVAELVRHMRKDKSMVTGKPNRLVKRMYDFAERLTSALRGTGFQDFEDVINRIESGEIGQRKRGEVRTLRSVESGLGAVPERGIGQFIDEDQEGLGIPPDPDAAPFGYILRARRAVGAPETDVRPEVADAYRRMQDGEITREQYDTVVLGTISPYDFVPVPATYQEMYDALRRDKKDKVNVPIEDGTEVGLRLDIPAYTDAGVWVPTIHGMFGKDSKGKIIRTSHRATASILNADFTQNKQDAPQRVMEGQVPGTEGFRERQRILEEIEPQIEEIRASDMDSKAKEKAINKLKSRLSKFNKSTFARIQGSFVNRTDEETALLAEQAINDPAWTQVGFDPRRHSYFYDRKTGEPVTFAEEVIQVGPLVLAKNATKSALPSGEQFQTLYSKRQETARPAAPVGDSLTPNTQSLPDRVNDSQRAVEDFENQHPAGTVAHAANQNPEHKKAVAQQEMLDGAEPLSIQSGSYSLGKRFIYQIQDKFVGLKDVENQVNNWRRMNGLDELTEDQSPYRGEESIPGKIGFAVREFEERRKKPLAKKIADLDIPIDEVDDFLTLRHAIERNRTISLRDPQRDPESNPGSGQLRDGEVLTDSFVKNRMLSRYGMSWDDASGTWSGGNARGKKLQSVASDADQIVRETMNATVDGGLISKDNADVIMGSYKYYAPLKGKDIEDDYAENVIVGSGLSTKGKETLRAMGRESSAQSPLGHILLNAERSIARGLKNKEFGQRLINLVNSSPDSEFWEVISKDNPKMSRGFEKKFTYVGKDPELQGGKYTEIPPGANPKDFLQLITVKPDFFSPTMDSDLIGVKVNGEQQYVRINDARLRDAITAFDVGTVDNLITKFGVVNRWLSMVNTSLNPEFVIGNFSRDVQTAIFNILGEQNMSSGKAKDQKLVRQILKDVIPSMGAFYKGLRRYDLKDETLRGSLFGMSSKDQADFLEFVKAGAKADWFHSRPPEDQVKTIQAMIEMANGTAKGNLMKRYEQVTNFVEDTNSAVENAVRFAAFKASRDQMLDSGIDRDTAVKRASSLAKNLTINFNRKGMSGDFLNSLFLFFNASVQGTANFARGLFGPKGNPFSNEASRIKQGAVGGLMLMGALSAMRGEEESEENPVTGRSYYSEIPDYVKERNMVIMAENGKDYYTIPLPYGYNTFHVIGQSVYEMGQGNMSLNRATSNILSTFLGSFSPVGFSPIPTIAQPAYEIAKNENFFGGPIYRENLGFGPPLPDSQLQMASTRAPFVETAKILNKLSQGNEQQSGSIDISPDTLEHYAEFLLGGAGTFGLRTFDAIDKWSSGEKLETREIPFLRRIKGEPNMQQSTSDYYDRKFDLEQAQLRLGALRGSERVKFRKENRDLLRLARRMEDTEKRLRELRKRRNAARENASRSPAAALRSAEIERNMYDRIAEEQGKFNKLYDKTLGRTN
tara:strand:- start:52 stop:7359 length:7308 start_codon:yes stop_codon:yes gene_type:complete